MQALTAIRTKYAHHQRYFATPRRRAKQSGTDLALVQDNTQRIRQGDLLVFVTLRNEQPRIPFFLDYYRRSGVAHFLFVDNGSTDGFAAHVKGADDCSVWRTEASYKASNFGVYWINHLPARFGVGHWCLTLDPDEIMVWPYCESRNILELIEFLEMEDRDHLFCLLLDMYGRGGVAQTTCAPGQDPIEAAPYFDTLGYSQRADASYGETFVQGGPRRRMFFRDNPADAPALNKTPLIKWQPNFHYLSSTHTAAPKRLNRAHDKDTLAPTGCLLHFKFLSMLKEKVAEEMVRGEHYAGSAEYRRYDAVLSGASDSLFYEHSVRYESSRQLQELGLMSFGQWF
jgi:hypothetical protein